MAICCTHCTLHLNLDIFLLLQTLRPPRKVCTSRCCSPKRPAPRTVHPPFFDPSTAAQSFMTCSACVTESSLA